MKKTAILLLISLLLLSTLSYVSSTPISRTNAIDELQLESIEIKNDNQDIEIEEIDVNPKPMQSRTIANSPWPMFRQNLNHTGLSPYNTSTNPGTLMWEFITGDNVDSSPAIGSNGTIYVGSFDGNLYAIYPNGTEKWSYTMLNEVHSSPAIGPDGTIYVGTSYYITNSYLSAINPDGTEKWTNWIWHGVDSSPVIGSDGTIYFGGGNGHLNAINPNGTYKWGFQTGWWERSTPAIGPDGIIYFGSYDNNLYAIYPNGTEKWNYTTGNPIRWSSPAVGSDGTIYLGSCDENVYAINPNGTKKWSVGTGNWVRSSPAIGSDGTVYIGSTSNKLFSIGTPLNIFSGCVNPLSGYTNTHFNYTVKYLNKFNKPPFYVKVKIDGINYSLIEADSNDINYLDGKDFYFNITHLDIGLNNYQFWASDGINVTSTLIFNNPIVYNTPPYISTPDNTSAYEDDYYEETYQYEDIDRENIGQLGTWNFSTDADWLLFNLTSGVLSGTPLDDDVKKCWVNISINDTMAIDFTNFTISVFNVNDGPIINTSNVEITYEDKLYSIDYNASDVDSDINNQIWSLDTNATSWLNLDANTGLLNGVPTNDEVGEYWVNVSVVDGDGGLGYTYFTLIVINVNDPPMITTEYTMEAPVNELYSVDYNATDIDSPLSLQAWSLTTNASSWLAIDSITGVLSGTPTANDVGDYNVNVTVDDGDGGSDWQMFTLMVMLLEEPENEPPVITTIDKVSITAGDSYKVIYEATDDRTPIESLIWSFNSNASWLSFNYFARVLGGNPTLSHVGWYWVNITVGDGEGGFDSHNFTVTVYATENQPPIITTDDVLYAIVDQYYYVDYDATDDRTPLDYLEWSLSSNASWLSMNPSTGVLNGTPELQDLGWYWVEISVDDGEEGWDSREFTLTVSKEPIIIWPELINPSMTPSEGDTETEFTFSVDYSHRDNKPPDIIQVVIDGSYFDLKYNASSDSYEYTTRLPEGIHTYYFTTTVDTVRVDSEDLTTPNINQAVPPTKPGKDEDDNTLLYASLGIIAIIIVIVIILVFLFVLRKKQPEEEPVREELQPAEPVPQPSEPVPQPAQIPQVAPPQPQPVLAAPPPQPVVTPTVAPAPVIPRVIPKVVPPPIAGAPVSDEELEE
ncbi:MAG: PQQ-binding-like beta-propeller repeat protein [Thermoplasmata archaeon]|nr:PQQ-binding-like beta-propeller repeat protein [Thermoplasmata archaeon]